MKDYQYAIIIRSVCARLNIAEPNDTLIRNVTEYCKRLNLKELRQRHANENELFIAVAESYVNSLKPKDEFDYSTYLNKTGKKERDVNSALTHWLSEQMPVVASKSMSVYIDSRMRNTYEPDFAFTLVPRQMKTTFGDGNIQVGVMPASVTYFKIGKISLPYSESMRANNATNELTMTFTALRSNGILAWDDTYHFIFTFTVSSLNSNMVELTPLNEYCKFSPPLAFVNDISFRFNDPFVGVAFPMDRMVVNSLNYLSSDGRILFDRPHTLRTGDTVIIQKLSTNNDSVNSAILSQINNPRGIRITVIDATTIALGIDFTLLQLHDVNCKPLVVFYSRTFRFPLEIGYQGEL